MEKWICWLYCINMPLVYMKEKLYLTKYWPKLFNPQCHHPNMQFIFIFNHKTNKTDKISAANFQKLTVSRILLGDYWTPNHKKRRWVRLFFMLILCYVIRATPGLEKDPQGYLQPTAGIEIGNFKQGRVKWSPSNIRVSTEKLNPFKMD